MGGQSVSSEVDQTAERMAAYLQHRLGNLYTGMRMVVDAVPEAGSPVPAALAPRLALAADELERTRIFSLRLGRAFGPLPSPSPTFLEDSVERCCAELQARHLTLRVKRSGSDVARATVCRWGNYLERALAELLENAAGNLGGDEEIEVELRVSAGQGSVAVHQAGVWPASVPATPPLPFRGERGAAGLGLTIAYRHVLALGGSLAVCDERPGSVTVRLSLPLETVDA